MNVPSLNLIPKLQSSWTIDENLLFPTQTIEKPKFDNLLDEIIYILEHENDPLPLDYDELVKSMANQITHDIDNEIINSLISASKGIK